MEIDKWLPLLEYNTNATDGVLHSEQRKRSVLQKISSNNNDQIQIRFIRIKHG